jgi:RNA polymerase-binding transcription factor DksA
MMPTEERSTAATTPVSDGPQWRALLEARWQARLEELIELSLAYHAAAETAGDGGADGPGRTEEQALPRRAEEQALPRRAEEQTLPRRAEEQALLRRAVGARRKLEDVEEALGRLAAGRYGRCEQCGAGIPAGLLALIPETRYCPRCDAPPGPGRAGRSPR